MRAAADGETAEEFKCDEAAKGPERGRRPMCMALSQFVTTRGRDSNKDPGASTD